MAGKKPTKAELLARFGNKRKTFAKGGGVTKAATKKATKK